MKQKIKSILSLIILLSGCMLSIAQDEDGLLPKPNPPVAITDAANVIGDDIQAYYEQQLTALEASTSIAVVVVTIPSLKDHYEGNIEEYATDLFNKWGIGHKGSNNGILLLFAMEDRKVRIETGKGMEEYLTDVTSQHIIDNNITSHFKNGDPQAGFKDGIETLISYVKTQIPSEEKRLMIAKQREKEAQETREMWYTIGQYASYIIILGLICLLIYHIDRSIKRKKEHKLAVKKAKEIASILLTKLNSIDPAMLAAKAQHDTYPSWAQNEASQYRAEIRKLYEEMERELATAQGYIDASPEKAIALIESLFSRYEHAENAYKKSVEALPVKIKFYETEAVHEKEKTCGKLSALKERLLELQKTYTIFADDEEAYNLLDQEYSLLENIEEHKDLYDASKMLQQKIDNLQQSIDAELQLPIDNASRITLLRKQSQQPLRDIILLADKALKYLIANAIKEVWSPLEGNFTRAQQSISGIETKLKQAEQLNDMHNQKFPESKAILDSIEEQLKRNIALFDTVSSQHVLWEKAVIDLPILIGSATKLTAEALHIIKDSDVGRKAKEMAKSAANMLKEAETMLNLITKHKALQEVIKKAKDSIERAKKDIRDAEDERAATRRRASAAASAASYSSTYSSGSGFSSGGSSSFGGFGGGSSGGGGATGGW